MMQVQSPTKGFSRSAQQIEKMQNTIAMQLKRNRSYVIQSLQDIFLDSLNADWAGHASKAVLPETFHWAVKLIQSLPDDIDDPDIGVESDGHITMEWYISANRTVTISIDDKGNLYFAGLIGLQKIYGDLPFYGTFPQALITQICRL